MLQLHSYERTQFYTEIQAVESWLQEPKNKQCNALDLLATTTDKRTSNSKALASFASHRLGAFPDRERLSIAIEFVLTDLRKEPGNRSTEETDAEHIGKLARTWVQGDSDWVEATETSDRISMLMGIKGGDENHGHIAAYINMHRHEFKGMWRNDKHVIADKHWLYHIEAMITDLIIEDTQAQREARKQEKATAMTTVTDIAKAASPNHLAPSGWITVTGLDLPQGYQLTAAEEDAMMLVMTYQGDQRQWCRGDWALYVRNKVNARAEAEGWSTEFRNTVWDQELRKLADRFGCSHITLQKNISCCAAWPVEYRRASKALRFKHHELFSRSYIEEHGWDQVMEMMDDADAAEMTYKQLAVYINTGELPDGSKHPAKVQTHDAEDGHPLDEEIPFTNMGDADDEDWGWQAATNVDDLFGTVGNDGDVDVTVIADGLHEQTVTAHMGRVNIEIRMGGTTWLVTTQQGEVKVEKVIEVLTDED